LKLPQGIKILNNLPKNEIGLTKQNLLMGICMAFQSFSSRQYFGYLFPTSTAKGELHYGITFE
jgi:hypothetical protein